LPEEEAPVFKDLKVASKEKCCEACAHDADCVDFVFESAHQACVLLPHVSMERIDQVLKDGVISGSARITIASPPPAPPPVAHCTFATGMAYAGGVLPKATKALVGQRLTKQECCSACAAALDCGKMSLDAGTPSWLIRWWAAASL